MSGVEHTLQRYGVLLLESGPAKEKHARYFVSWVRRFLDYAAGRKAMECPRIDAACLRDYIAWLAPERGVSASTQNQAFRALLFFCREALSLNVEEMGQGVRARLGIPIF